MLQPLVQKYPSAYYVYRKGHHQANVHGMMSDGIVSWYDNKDDALRVCEGYNARRGLPDVNVDRSSQYHLKKGP